MDSMGSEQDFEPGCQMMRALWLRLGRVWGWQRAEKPKPKAKRMPKCWWKRPAPFDRAWRKGIIGRPL
jgi:hypothetical protein